MFGNYFKNAAERIAVLFRFVDTEHHLPLSCFIGTVKRGITRYIRDLLPCFRKRYFRHTAQLDNVAVYMNAKCRKELFCYGTAGDTSGCFACGSTLENIAKITCCKLLSACQVGVSGPRS